MSNRSKAAGRGAGRKRRLGQITAGLAASLMLWTLGAGDARAERIVLTSGEVIDGSIVEATRNTVVVRRSIGGMRQMRMKDIAEVRIDLPQGQTAGEFLSWADGVYELGSGDEVIRVSEGGIVSREPRPETAERTPSRPPSRAAAEQQTAAAAAPSATAERPLAPAAGDEDQANAAAAAQGQAAAEAPGSNAGEAERRTAAVAESSDAPDSEAATPAPAAEAGDDRSQAGEAAAEAQGSAANEAERQTAAVANASDTAETAGQAATPAQAAAAGEGQSEADDAESKTAADAESKAAADAQTRAAAAAENPAGAGAQNRALAGEESAAAGDQASLAVDHAAALMIKASVDPHEPGGRNLVFEIELSQPADQAVVVIYGTVDGTAKAGEDYEAQQGMVTLAPGDRSAEVRVPLLEGEAQGTEKQFELVLMADPKVAEVVDRRVIATIKGAD